MKMQRCPACRKDQPYDADTWRNYSREPGSRTRYVCGVCAPPEGEMVGQNLDAPKLKLERFDMDGLKAKCQAEGCNGVVMIRRDHDTFHLVPDSVHCTLCGQSYEIDTNGLSGWPLEDHLRAAGDHYDEET